MAVSQKEIANFLGVSQALVGMALNDHPRISAATRERVENAAKQLGYDRDLNSGARQMAAKRHGIRMLNNVIAVCSNPSSMPMHQQPFETDILNGIESVTDKLGVDVLMCRLRPVRLPRLIEKQEVDGAITVSSSVETLSALKHLDFPVVHLGSAAPGIHSVSAEHYRGTALVTSHLLDLGHRQVAYIGYDVKRMPDESVLADAAKERFRSFCEVMETSGIAVKYAASSLSKSFPEYGARAFEALWKQSRHGLTAVVCYNDTLAMGVVQAAQQMGLAVPRDLSVVGFDAVSDRFSFLPFITSAGYDRVLMGRRAVEILLQCRHGNILSPKGKNKFIREVLPVHFVEGATTAPPRKRMSK
jgi:LacI family transcriptional regulator